jgi:hypothetical protein
MACLGWFRTVVRLIASSRFRRTLSLCNNSINGALPAFLLNATWITYASLPYHGSAHWHSVMGPYRCLSLQIAAVQFVDVRPDLCCRDVLSLARREQSYWLVV